MLTLKKLSTQKKEEKENFTFLLMQKKKEEGTDNLQVYMVHWSVQQEQISGTSELYFPVYAGCTN